MIIMKTKIKVKKILLKCFECLNVQMQRYMYRKKVSNLIIFFKIFRKLYREDFFFVSKNFGSQLRDDLLFFRRKRS